MDTINQRYADALRRIFEDSPQGRRTALRHEIADLAIELVNSGNTALTIFAYLEAKVAELQRLEEKYPELKELT